MLLLGKEAHQLVMAVEPLLVLAAQIEPAVARDRFGPLGREQHGGVRCAQLVERELKARAKRQREMSRKGRYVW